MTTIIASRALDMRLVVPEEGRFRASDGRASIADDPWRTVFTGPFQKTDTGFTGTLSAMEQTRNGRTVFEATDIARSADLAFARVKAHENDAFLAFVLSGDDLITGSRKGDYLIAYLGDDRIDGGRGNDQLFGLGGNDILNGGRGDDVLNGGIGDDTMTGGKGDDVYYVDSKQDIVVEKRDGGFDSIMSSVSLKVAPSIERLVLIGEENLNARGGANEDKLIGNSGNNRLSGGGGEDLVIGGLGRDVIIGGEGADNLYGGRGADTFRFSSENEADDDRLADFGLGKDRIDLSRIDADTTRRGNQSFEFNGDDGFTRTPGELATRSGILAGDTDGDGVADFVIHLTSAVELREADFIL